MSKLFSLFSLRIVSLGGAKASTHGLPEGSEDEVDVDRYDP